MTPRNDAAAARRAAGHLGAIVLCAAALWTVLGSRSSIGISLTAVWAVPLTLLLGYLLAFLFNALHETAHQTAFRTRAWNYLLGHLAAFVILLPYGYYRAFHWDHHRYTQDPDKDPELAVPPPASTRALAWYVLGPPVWIGRIRMLLVHGLAGRVAEPWVAADQRRLIVVEARCYLLAYAGIVGLSLALGSSAALWLWLLPVMLGQWFIRPYLLAEHTGCAHTPHMLENTRTTYTNAFVHFFAWNMPYHAEHHAYPAVPFHALPRLNTLLAAHIVHTEQGYLASARTVLRHVQASQAGAAAGAEKPVNFG